MIHNKIKLVFFNGTLPHFVYFGNKIISAKYEKKNKKSLGVLPGNELLYTKSMGFMGHFLYITKESLSLQQKVKKDRALAFLDTYTVIQPDGS